jgi:hypothetical protein
MDDQLIETPAQVHAFAPKHDRRDCSNPTDEAGQALVAMLQDAAKFLNDNIDRAMAVVRELSIQLEANNDRIGQLQVDVELFRGRAAGAEKWLQRIQKEIETRLMTTF